MEEILEAVYPDEVERLTNLDWIAKKTLLLE